MQSYAIIDERTPDKVHICTSFSEAREYMRDVWRPECYKVFAIKEMMVIIQGGEFITIQHGL